MSHDVIDTLTSAPLIGKAADLLGDAVKDAYASGGEEGLRIKNALNGVWLGHPLHPALTDVPLGAWTAAIVLDAAHVATGRDDVAGCAGAAVAVGIAGAVAAAAAGVTDWSDTDGRSRRIGFVHGMLNLTATGLFAVSLAMRRSGRGRGRLAALFGYAAALGAAYLGGELVYGRRIGVNHAPGLEIKEFTRVLTSSDLAERQLRRAMIASTPMLLVRERETVRAIAETCSHLGGPLSEGTLKDGAVVCPWHGSCFALADGHVVNGPATHAQPCYEARVRDGQIELRMPRQEETPAVGGVTAIESRPAAS